MAGESAGWSQAFSASLPDRCRRRGTRWTNSSSTRCTSARSRGWRAPPPPPTSARRALEVELRNIIDESALSDERITNARKDLKRILVEFRSGKSPFVKLNPHSFCASCPGGLSKEGNPHRTHEFFCMSRKQKPSRDEQAVRSKVFSRLRAAWPRSSTSCR